MTPDISPLARLDSFPYRHRLSEVMSRPVLTGRREMTLAQACEQMDAARVSSLVVVDDHGRTLGIVTERDVLSTLSRLKVDALDLPVAEIMSSPVHTVPGEAFLFVGIARMMRLGLRHLVVVDEGAKPVGMVTGRALLKVRASEALVIGDDVSQAHSASDLARAQAELPGLAAGLLADDVSPRTIAGIIGMVLRDMTARAAELAEAAMLVDGWGAAPAPWAVLILGSGGRGESLLAFDQDNAIVHGGSADDDSWYIELGRRMNDLLNEAGIRYCAGEVMAGNAQWCRSLDGWKAEIRRWVFEPKMQTVMYVDIFFDFTAVRGDPDLARDLKDYAVVTASSSAFFLQFLSLNVAQMDIPLGLLGRFVTHRGRLDLKKSALLPVVSAARAKALAARIAITGTAERYTALAAAKLMHPDDLASLLDAHETILRALLVQQLADLGQGQQPSSQIEPGKLPGSAQRQLKTALRRIQTLKTLIGSVMAG
jgi:signal-transduction protein with cAMP-binding, CBS, and nucleotidyltransferase domain